MYATRTAIRSGGIELLAATPSEATHIVTRPALRFVAELERRSRARRRDLLVARKMRQARFDAGLLPGFLEETADVRAADWRIAPVPADLEDRRVEITGPVDRKMVINALNSGARTYMADFEDSHAPPGKAPWRAR